ncbi:aminoglycoside phosphotransferase family protein [Streptacidiphilus sp. N1-10]|uniref:Aminoglycoside phosphotransferase family protein n=1 Tax=Streptacidiphilus jeojiensis TaxID=3229225 RepID=A0ABV6XV24_9ACTN
MSSPTQRRLTPEQAADLVRRSLGPDRRVTGASPLSGGGFAAVWRVDLDDGSAVVLKTAPPTGAVLLRYEQGLLAAEAEYFRLVRHQLAGAPVPEVLHLGTDRDHCDGDWLVMSLLPGTPLSVLRDGPVADGAVRYELGRVLARLHTLDGPFFGYPGEGRRSAPTWRAAFLGIIDDLLDDADRLGSELPVPAAEIRRTISAASGVLDEVKRPTPVHFDLWDGNVLAEPRLDGAGLRLSGLVDGERWLYGDPLVDFVSPVLFGAIEEEDGHPLLRGYASVASEQGDWTWEPGAVARVRLYRAWLYLVMNVEIPTRGPMAAEHRTGLAGLLKKALDAVAESSG